MVAPEPGALLFGLAHDTVVCGACHDIRGSVEGRFGTRFHQRCSCEPWPDERPILPGYDFPTAAELCRCCAAVLLASGSKFSVWFCETCKQLVRAFNDEVGSYVIPIGRHSFMAGLALSGRDARDDLAIRRFALAMASWGERIGWVGSWAPSATRHNMIILGLDARHDVALAEYLRLVSGYRGADLTSAAAFERLIAAL